MSCIKEIFIITKHNFHYSTIDIYRNCIIFLLWDKNILSIPRYTLISKTMSSESLKSGPSGLQLRIRSTWVSRVAYSSYVKWRFAISFFRCLFANLTPAFQSPPKCVVPRGIKCHLTLLFECWSSTMPQSGPAFWRSFFNSTSDLLKFDPFSLQTSVRDPNLLFNLSRAAKNFAVEKSLASLNVIVLVLMQTNRAM